MLERFQQELIDINPCESQLCFNPIILVVGNIVGQNSVQGCLVLLRLIGSLSLRSYRNFLEAAITARRV